MWGIRVSSRVTTGESGFPSSCRWELDLPLELQQGELGRFSSCSGELGFPLKLLWEISLPLELRWGSRAFSCIATAGKGILSSCETELRTPLKMQWESLASA